MGDEYKQCVEEVKDIRYQIKAMKGIISQLVETIMPRLLEYETCDCEECDSELKTNNLDIYNN
ncbi:MAG: hypothetical protein KJ906_03340 [Nanoarchaeota archaeon]|nr:hypothetical protein [Nanoarchaeota archaeon]